MMPEGMYAKLGKAMMAMYGFLWSDLGNVYDLSHLLKEKTMMHQV